MASIIRTKQMATKTWLTSLVKAESKHRAPARAKSRLWSRFLIDTSSPRIEAANKFSALGAVDIALVPDHGVVAQLKFRRSALGALRVVHHQRTVLDYPAMVVSVH